MAMAESRAHSGYSRRSPSGSGTISRIRLENFMCHSNLQIELGRWVNFITGQNGSGKSAILTALCVAFGCRAKETQRAATLKDFIKTGCSYAIVEVEIRNIGDEPFKPDVYGDAIIIERRINLSSSTTVLKDHLGRKVANHKDELRELVDHFNIDVENPCVIMSQDKSREFLHSGNDKDKFRFFFKATHLQQVDDLLKRGHEQLLSSNAFVEELEDSIKPIEKELAEMQEKITYMEHLEEITQEVQLLKKKLAWSWVYSIDKNLVKQSATIRKLKDRIPACQAKIDEERGKVETLRDYLSLKRSQTTELMQKTSEVRRKRDELQNSISKATKEKFELEQDQIRENSNIKRLVRNLRSLEQQAQDFQEQKIRNTQAEESEIETKIKELQDMVDDANSKLLRLKEEECSLSQNLSKEMSEIRKISQEMEGYKKKEREIYSRRDSLLRHRTNKVTAFGGNKVMHLLHAIERNHRRFKRPPIGPIGAHLTLANGDAWALAVENAIGKFLNAFIVANHKDSILLRRCATDARYKDLKIVICDFSRPRLTIPPHMLPQTPHPTTLSAIHSDNDTVINALVDTGNAESQVLVKDYEVGKNVAFDRRIPNLKEVYTRDGYKMFVKQSTQIVIPPPKNLRAGRLCSSYDDEIKKIDQIKSKIERGAKECKKRKRYSETNLQDIQHNLKAAKKNCLDAELFLSTKKRQLQDGKKLYATETISAPASTIDELLREISEIKDQIKNKERSLEMLQARVNEADTKAKDLKLLFEDLHESAKFEIDAFKKAEIELTEIEKDLQYAEGMKARYESTMIDKVIPEIKAAEAQYQKLDNERQDNFKKASAICPESDIEAMGGWDESTPEQLSAKLNLLTSRLQHEIQQYCESTGDPRILYQKKEHKILRKRQTYKAFREKLKALNSALKVRKCKFDRNVTDLRRQLTWNFNGHLGKKGISGSIQVSYKEKTLGIEVRMPQDASSTTVHDTRGLSGGERSFSTLCFALALHEMIESPFRAMDEFDVYMDAVSRKISLDTLVDFALNEGSQWILITPHDISIVKQDERIRKQQMAAPRS